MALLTTEQRKARFKFLGLGEYNSANIKKFQKKAFPSLPKEQDGKYGTNTDRALRHFYNVRKVTKNFEPEEFKCNCGRCTGYPTYMKQVELKHIQKIRTHYGKPMVITSGLRCAAENRRVGGVTNSGHLKGYAVDFYMKGVTETIAQRKKALSWIVKQENHEFTYGAYMTDSKGTYRTASGMGNAMHTETHKPPVTKTKQQKMVEWAEKIAADNSFIYVHYDKNDPKTRKCPICNGYKNGKYHGFYCTRWNYSVWKHGGGLPIKCINAPNNGQIEKIAQAKTDAEALSLARKYFHLTDIKVIRSKSTIPQSKLKAGDLCYHFSGNTCQHAFVYVGDGKMIDANSVKDPIAKRKAMSCGVAIRYIGK